MLVPALILGVTGYALYRYYSSDDDDQLPPPARLSPARPFDLYSSGYYSDYSDYDSDTAGAYGSTRVNSSVTTGAYDYPGATVTATYRSSAGHSGASTSASYRTPSYSGTYHSGYTTRNPARSSVHQSTTGTRTYVQRNNQPVGNINQTQIQRSNNNRTTGNRNNNNNNRNQQNSTESTKQLQLRRSVLRHFKCPFEEEDACRFKQNPQQCLFTHVGLNGTGAANLKEVPAYACIYHLINSCRSVNNATATSSQNPNSIQNILPCINGIHLSTDQMADLDRYERANRQTIRRFFGRDADRECGVCLETVLSKRLSRTRRFAILENCEHCFCVQCIVGWRGQNVELTCPLCRTVSRRVVYRRRFTDKPEYKRNLFR